MAAAEVDFLFQYNNIIYPVEVKAGKTGTLKSMHVYLFEKKLKTGVRFNTDTPSVAEFKTKVQANGRNSEISIQLISMPLYMICQLPRLIGSMV